MLRYLEKERSPWELISLVDADLNDYIANLKCLIDCGLVEVIDGKLKLTEKGMEEKRKLKAKLYETRCSKCDGRGLVEDAFGVLEDYKKISSMRPKPTSDYDQGYIKEEDVMRRIAFIYERGDLEGMDILVVGDDDLISIGMALTGLPNRIVVLEIDDRLIQFINKVAGERNLNIVAQKFDVRYDIDEELRGKFDVFITDPVETIDGITLFLSRAASGLKGKGCSGYFGLTHEEASLRKWFEIEQRLMKMNFVITDMIRDFNVYPMKDNLELALENYKIFQIIEKMTGNRTVDADFYRSTLIRVEAIDTIKPLVNGTVEIKKEMYVDDESLVTALATRD